MSYCTAVVEGLEISFRVGMKRLTDLSDSWLLENDDTTFSGGFVHGFGCAMAANQGSPQK